MTTHIRSVPCLLAATTIAAAATVGCEMPGGSPAIQGDYVEAVPRQSQVSIDVPGTLAVREGEEADDHISLAEAGEAISLRGTQRVLGELAAGQRRATFYQATYDVSRAVNGFVFALIAVIKEVDRWPATSETAGSRTWGPWTEALSPVTLKFTIRRDAGGAMTFSLEGKPKRGSDGQYAEFLGGSFVGTGRGRGHGDLYIDANTARTLDPEGSDGVGRVDIRWNNSVEPRSVELALRDFADRAGEPTASALYRYREAADSSGTFEFLVEGDLDKDNDPGSLKTRREKLAIVSRWLASGAGRSDVVIQGGDLPWPTVHAQECWDSDFWRTFYTDDRQLAEREGDPATCVLPPL